MTALRLLTRLFLRFWRWLTLPDPVPHGKICDCCGRAGGGRTLDAYPISLMKSKRLIGHASQLLDLLTVTQAGKDRVKLLFAGQPGIGKTEIATRLGESLCGGKWGLEVLLGREVTIYVVKAWRQDFATSSLFGSGFKCIVVNEIDLCQRDALDQMLDLLDQLPAGRGIIGTTNCAIEDLPERFRTRFARHTVRAPETTEIEAWLREEFDLPPAIAAQVASLSGGNVRAAMLDAESYIPTKPKERRAVAFQGTLATLGL